VILVIALALAGCGENTPAKAYNVYLDRLARTLDVEPAPIGEAPAPALPAPRQLRLDLPPGNLDVLDFLALSGCAVQVTIGKRNSSLGRMARASQRLLLELEYLQLAPECIAYQRKRGETALADTLQAAWDLKREQLPALIFNATLGSDEYRRFWRGPTPSADYPGNTGSAVVTALTEINALARRWLDGDYRADNQGFELLLAEVAGGDGGSLLRALALQASGLEAADRVLQQRLARGPLCGPSRRPAAADILPNVVRRFFIEGIQPRAAALNRRYHELLPAITELERMLDPALPPAYLQWRGERNNGLQEHAMAPRRHVKVLQRLQAPCLETPDLPA
jgi:hypothetical protein